MTPTYETTHKIRNAREFEAFALLPENRQRNFEYIAGERGRDRSRYIIGDEGEIIDLDADEPGPLQQ